MSFQKFYEDPSCQYIDKLKVRELSHQEACNTIGGKHTTMYDIYLIFQFITVGAIVVCAQNAYQHRASYCKALKELLIGAFLVTSSQYLGAEAHAYDMMISQMNKPNLHQTKTRKAIQ